MRAVLALVAALVATPVHALALGEITAALAAVDASRARFTEMRYVAALGMPIERKGTLAYARPGRLDLVVESPVAERLSIAGGKLTIDARGSVRTIELATGDPLLAWIEGIRATLAGDEAALRRSFEPAVSGTLDRWSLVLVPRDAKLRSLVMRIAIGGERDKVRSIEIDEVAGDRSVMSILPEGSSAR